MQHHRQTLFPSSFLDRRFSHSILLSFFLLDLSDTLLYRLQYSGDKYLVYGYNIKKVETRLATISDQHDYKLPYFH